MDGQAHDLTKEIGITPDMVEAGVRAASLYDSTDSLEMIVRDVFSEMLKLLL